METSGGALAPRGRRTFPLRSARATGCLVLLCAAFGAMPVPVRAADGWSEPRGVSRRVATPGCSTVSVRTNGMG